MSRLKINQSFVSKVIIAILIVSLIPTIFISVFFYASSSKIVKTNVREASIQTARQAAESISYVLTTGSDMSNLIYSNEGIQQIIIDDSNPELSEEQREENVRVLEAYINEHTFSSSFIKMIYLLKEEGSSWGTGNFSWYKFSQYNIEELDWAKKAVELDGELVWQGLQYDPFSGAGDSHLLSLPITRVMKDFNNLSNIAYVQVLLDGNEIIERLNRIKLGKSGSFIIADEYGNVMVDRQVENINKPIKNKELYYHALHHDNLEFEFEEGGEKYYGVKQTLVNDWILIGFVPINEITGQLVSIQEVVLFSSILFGVIALMIGYVLANRVTKPVQVLTSQMKKVGKGDFKVRTDVRSADEIGVMSHEFNRMIEQVERLIGQVQEEQLHKKEAEIRAVKHRINPHFLFNTLSTIRWMLQFKQYEKANTALVGLIKLLEANMGKKGTFVTLMEELDIVKKFIDIMEIRYEMTFELQVDIEQELNGFLIPQMLLQPLVENAIFHGIVPTGQRGMVLITAVNEGEQVTIVVRDNGKGIDAKTLTNLQSMQKDHQSLGVGLLHIMDSVRLYFDSSSSVEIDSDHMGTSITLILIPSKDKGGAYV